MTRLAAHILATIRRGPRTTLYIAQTLDEQTATVERELRKLVDAGVVEHTSAGWELAERSPA